MSSIFYKLFENFSAPNEHIKKSLRSGGFSHLHTGYDSGQIIGFMQTVIRIFCRTSHRLP